jgi:glycolate dehydrogenase iron-sulfur subunit
MEELARLMRDLEEQLGVCMRCGMCQVVCPVFEQTGREADVARGKLALLDGLLRQLFEDPDGVRLRLEKCLLCGSCAANCPSGVSVLEIFLKARGILTGYMGLSPTKRLMLRGLLGHPKFFDRLVEWGARFQGLLTRPANDVLGTSCARLVSPVLGDRHFRQLADHPFHRTVASLDRPPGPSGITVALFVGCLIDKLFPTVARATVDVLEAHDFGIFVPGDQGCCGIPALSGGDLSTFRELMAHNLRRFSEGRFDVLVTACATCTATLREIWPVMAGKALAGQARRLAEKTMDINQFLVGTADVRSMEKNAFLTPPVTVTYHDPCHLKNTLKIWEEPRALITAGGDYHLVEMDRADACCGMGGSFNLKYYEISARIGQRKAEQITATGADILATGCPACMVQISDMLSKSGSRIRVRHPVEIHADTLKKRLPI